MKYLWKDNTVKLLHIELTNFCNAACPFCPRFVDATDILRPDIKLDQMTIEQFKEWFPQEVLIDVSRILFCGTHGDPMMARDLLDIVRYIRETAPHLNIMFITNGGMRKPEFWSELGNLLKVRPAGSVTFSIDGLEDTNHLYRRNVKWDILIDNVKAYTDTGANASWDFLTFKHNEHQLQEAEALSKELKIKNFLVKRALGFEEGNGGFKARGIYDRDGNLDYVIEPPSEQSLVNVNEYKDSKKSVSQTINLSYLKTMKETKVHAGVAEKLANFSHENVPHWNTYVLEYDHHEIKCKSDCSKNSEKTLTEVYISCHGIVYPCCYVGTRVESSIDLYEDTQLRYALKNAGLENFSLKNKSLKDIVNGGFLDSVFTASWDRPSTKDGKLSYCAMTCGEKSQIDKIYVNPKWKS